MKKIRAAVVGYGNIGHYTLQALEAAPDFEVAGIVRRQGAENKPEELSKYEVVKDIRELKDVDVAILATPTRSVEKYAKDILALGINTVDSFDTHAKVTEYYNQVNEKAIKGNKISIISVGWDPGLFSINRLYAETILPIGNTYTFWGKGVSQGHSDAIRRISGVKNAVQYTIPIEDAVEAVREGNNPVLTTRQKHLRECFVVLEEGADGRKIEEEIKTMPNYFADYDTNVYFISEEELNEKHSKMPHGGFVIRSGKTGMNEQTKQIIEYSLKLESNPEFTANVLLSYARATYKLHEKGETGARTVLDIPPAMLSTKTTEELLKTII